MYSGKEATSLLLSLLICSAVIGCLSPQLAQRIALELPGARPSDPGLPPSRVDAQAVPELRIPSAPISKAAPAGTSKEILLAAATEPSGPSPVSPDKVTTPAPLAESIRPLPTPENDPAAKLRSLYGDAAARYAAVDSYIVRLRRREQVNGKDNAEEVILFKFRKQPWSIHFKWLGTQGHGREVIYVKGHYGDKIHTLLAAGDMPLMPAGKRMALAPDSALVRCSSRHAIDEAGIGSMIERFGRRINRAESGNKGTGALKYLGPLKRPELETPCEAVEQEIAPGGDALLPRGGRRLWLFEPETKFPVFLSTRDDTGHEVEYYCYDRFEFPVKLDDDDFNPDKLWPPGR